MVIPLFYTFVNIISRQCPQISLDRQRDSGPKVWEPLTQLSKPLCSIKITFIEGWTKGQKASSSICNTKKLAHKIYRTRGAMYRSRTMGRGDFNMSLWLTNRTSTDIKGKNYKTQQWCIKSEQHDLQNLT